MAKLKITIDPFAVVALFLFACFGWLEQILFYIIALVLHEYAHFYVAKRLGYSLNNIRFSPFGASLEGCKNYFTKKHEIIIALAGPLLNFALLILSIALWWVFPSTYSVTYNFALSNFALLLSNMLPIFPLDAGRIVLALIKSNKKYRFIYKLYRFNSILVGCIFAVLFFMSVFNTLNLSLLFISILLIMSNYNIDKDMYFRYAYMDKDYGSFNKPVPIKDYIISENISKYELLKMIDNNTYSVFHFVDKCGNIIKVINERDLLNKKD